MTFLQRNYLLALKLWDNLRGQKKKKKTCEVFTNENRRNNILSLLIKVGYGVHRKQ